MHLPARDRVLDAMVAALRPGGRLLIEEADHYPVSAMGPGLHTHVLATALLDPLAAAGVDWAFARRLPALLHQRGIAQVAAESEVALFEGGSPMADLLRLSIEQLRSAGLTGEVTDEQIGAWHTLVAQPGNWFHGFAFVRATGRRQHGC
jgi:hypothetical protein